MRLLDALIRRKLPVGRDAPDADAPDAYYPYPQVTIYYRSHDVSHIYCIRLPKNYVINVQKRIINYN